MASEISKSYHTLFKSEIPSIISASEWIRGLCKSHHLDEEDVFRMDLCVNELVQNLASYTNTGSKPCSFELSLKFQPQKVTMIVADDGEPFDPLSHPSPTPFTTLEEAPIGGLGIHLVRQSVDDIYYFRSGDQNKLFLEFKLKTPISLVDEP